MYSLQCMYACMYNYGVVVSSIINGMCVLTTSRQRNGNYNYGHSTEQWD